MVKQRVITGLLLAPLVLLSIYYSNLYFFVSVSTILLMACGIEYLQLIPLTHLKYQCLFMLALISAMILAHVVFTYWLSLGFLIWLFIVFAICSFPKFQFFWANRVTVTLFSILLLPLFTQSLIHIYQKQHGKAWIIYLLFLVWGADIGGYFVGKRWGQHPLIPHVSPGKTIEGAIGGGILSAIVALLAYPYFQPSFEFSLQSSITLWMTMAMIIFVTALIGDLFISMLKRRVHLKDTGNVIPGHGGILDRFDSLIPATPVFYVLLYWIS